MTKTLIAMTFASAASAGVLVNPGFEDPITQDGPPFVGFWEAFNGSANSAAFNSTVMPRSGAMHAEINILGDDNSFAGLFQDVGGLTAGDNVTFGGWFATPSNPLDVGVEFRIEFRDSFGDFEVSRTPNETAAPSGSQYEPFSLNAVVPAGADTARVVFAIQTFGGDGPSNSGVIYLDDMNFVPTPASLALIGFAGLASRRRR